MNTAHRESGYYWVRLHIGGEPGPWEVAHCDGLLFGVTYITELFDESAFAEINETRILTPDESERKEQ